ncbi:MAG: hypothetical protein ABIP95_01655 [Pelobium sp.]
MNEQFDKTLRDHIKDTFDHYDDQMAADGWKKFNQSKRRKRRAIIFWVGLPSGIAAALALLWMFNTYNADFNTQRNDQALAQQTQKDITNPRINNPEVTVEHNDSSHHQNKDSQPIAAESISKNNTSGKTLKNNQDNKTLATHKTAKTPILSGKLTPVNEVSDQVLVSNDRAIKNQASENKLTILAITDKLETREREETIKSIAKSFIEKLAVTSGDDQTKLSYNVLTAPLQTRLFTRERDLMAKEKNFINDNNLGKSPVLANNLKNSPTSDVMLKKKKFNLSVDANTYMNFSAGGLNDHINLGIGLASELKLTKNISLTSGVLINSQTSTFDGNEKSASDFKLASYYTGYAVVPNAQITNAKMVGIDIPLNLKLDLKLGKTDAFITSGISSYTVINEKYVNDYSVVNYSISGVNASNLRTIQDNPAGGNFSYFKFARTVNFSFGVLSKLSKRSSLSVEPFIKYPLSGLGYQDLKIGSGGLSFKLNFGK